MWTVWEFRSVDGKQVVRSIRRSEPQEDRYQHDFQRIIYRGFNYKKAEAKPLNLESPAMAVKIISPGAALSALRPDRHLICAWCGKPFTAKDSRARFCSNRCRQADKYQRNKTNKLEKK